MVILINITSIILNLMLKTIIKNLSQDDVRGFPWNIQHYSPHYHHQEIGGIFISIISISFTITSPETFSKRNSLNTSFTPFQFWSFPHIPYPKYCDAKNKCLWFIKKKSPDLSKLHWCYGSPAISEIFEVSTATI